MPATPPVSLPDALRESIAKVIYDAMRDHDPEGKHRPWVEHGNSLKQDEARARARDLTDALLPYLAASLPGPTEPGHDCRAFGCQDDDGDAHYRAPSPSIREEIGWIAEDFVDADLAHDDPVRAVRIMAEMLRAAQDSHAGASVPAVDPSRSYPPNNGA